MTFDKFRRPLALLGMFALLPGCGGGSGGSAPGEASGTIIIPPPPTSAPAQPSSAVAAVKAAAQPVTGGDQDHAQIIEAAASVRRILLGESTHGTHEYYRERARITERLVRDHGVNAVTIEGEWTPAFRVNLYVRGLGNDSSAAQALGDFTDFPQWMWRNVEFRDFVERLRAINLTRPPEQRVGIYGMDVYDLFDASEYVTAYLDQVDPAAAARVRSLYACFAPYGRSNENYGKASVDREKSCQDEAEAALTEVSRIPRPANPEAAERHFGAVRSAFSVAAAEEYFRISFTTGSSWNARDRRMERTVEDVAAHAEALTGQPGKTVSWSHNTHTGDARATQMGAQGELNLGQLMRERHGNAALLVGFFSNKGTVFAAPAWGAAGKVYTMNPALAGSHSALFRDTGIPAFSLLLRGNADLAAHFQSPMLQRAIGVIYAPATERQSHYFDARLSQQFDALIFFDQSQAVTPL